MTRADGRLALWLFGALLLTYWLTTGGHFYASDDLQKLAVLEAIFRHGTLEIPDGWSHGRENQTYSWFPLGASLLMVPGYLLGLAVTAIAPSLPADYVPRFAVVLENGIFTAGLATLVFCYLRWLGRTPAGSAFAALALGLGTMAWPYAKTAWSEPGAAVLIFGGLFALQVAFRQGTDGNARTLVLAGACLGGAALVRQELALVALFSLGWLAFQHRASGATLVRQVGWMAAPIVGAGLVSLWYELVRYGNPLTLPNYRLPQQRIRPPEGRLVWSLGNAYRYLLSPNQGLLWFSPPAALGILAFRDFFRAHRLEAGLFAVALGPLALFYMIGWGPSSWAWGLRYVYVFLPVLVLPLAFWWDTMPQRRVLVTAALVAGVAIQLLGAMQDSTRLFERALAARPGAVIQDLLVQPATSSLVLAVQAAPEAVGNGVTLIAGGPAAERVAAAYKAREALLPDWWPFLLLLGPLPRFAILTGALVLLVACVAAWTRFAKQLA